MELLEMNLPLKISVPISLQHVPSGSSVSPEMLVRALDNWDHTAGSGVGTGMSPGAVSKKSKDAVPPA
jgi:hypothetical protein